MTTSIAPTIAPTIDTASGTAGPGPGTARDAGPVRTWPVWLLAAPAFVAVWSGWVGLGTLTGFGKIHPLPGTPLAGWTLDTAITLPIGVETYAAYALRVWLSGRGSPRAVAFARRSAVGSLLLGAAGQVAYHLMTAAGVGTAPWWITALVATLPVLVLGMGAALAHLVRHGSTLPPTIPATMPDTMPETMSAAVSDTTGDTTTASVSDVVSDAVPVAVSDTTGDTTPDHVSDTMTDHVSDTVTAGRATRSRTTGAGAAGRRAPSTADRIARLRERHPDMAPAEIARRVKVTERTVQRHLRDTGTGPDIGPDGELGTGRQTAA